MNTSVKKTQDRDGYVQRIIDINFDGTNEQIISEIKVNTNRVLFDDMIDDLIENKENTIDFERKNRIKYEISTDNRFEITELDNLYIPPEKVEFKKFERLGIPAAVGSVIFGWLFYTVIGSFFKSEFHAALIGMPIGAWFFVWLFSKAIRHPRVAKVVKWAAVIGFASLTIGAVYSNIRGSIFGKTRINFIQWFWIAILAFLIFWMLHIFKPVKVKNTLEIKKAVEVQIAQFVSFVYTDFNEKLDRMLLEEPTKNLLNKNISTDTHHKDKIPVSLVSAKHVVPAIQQISTAVRNNNPKEALVSIKSFLNALESQGIKPLNRKDVFLFDEEEKEYFDTFGIIKIGDEVEQLYNAWTDADGNTIIRGKVRKVRR